MHAFHISPQRTQPQPPHHQQQHAAAASASDNPFSNPRLLMQPVTPTRHTSPYALARGASELDNRALAEAQRAAESGAVDADALLASLMLGGGDLSGSNGAQQAATLSGATYSSPLRAPATPLNQHHQQPPSPGLRGAASLPVHTPQQPSPARASSQEHEFYVLLKSAREGDCNAVRQLLAASAQSGAPLQIDSADRDGDTALHRACAGGHTAMVQLLVLEFGANIHLPNTSGDTPLLVNAQSGHPQLALLRFLVECGSDIHAKNKAGISVISLMGVSAATPQQQQSSHAIFGFSSAGALASPSSGSASAPLAEMQTQLMAAHASPVRQFVLQREKELANCRAELQVAREQGAALERMRQAQAAQLVAQEAQLRASGSAVHVASTQLRDMDAELERVAQAQTSAQGADAATAPQVLVSKVRRAIGLVRSAVTQASQGSG